MEILNLYDKSINAFPSLEIFLILWR